MRNTMKKACLGLVGVVAMGLAMGVAQPASADCGKMLIYSWSWVAPPPPPMPPVIVDPGCPPWKSHKPKPRGPVDPVPPRVSENPPSLPPMNPDPIPGLDDPYGVVPSPKEVSRTDSSTTRVRWGVDDTFSESNQQGVVAWNGKEEILILTTNEASLTGSSNAMLSVLPLPGPPTRIESANVEAFNKAKDLIREKASDSSVVKYGVFLTKKIGSHNIFVWQMDNIKTFKEEVQRYIAETYDNKAAVLITEKTEEVVNKYFKKGFRYFAFDLTLVDKQPSTKQAIAYQFVSKSAYFPLVVSQIGASGFTQVDLVVFTPGHVELGSKPTGDKPFKLFVTDNTTFEYNIDELRSIDDSVADLFKGFGHVRGGNFTFGGQIDGFEDDFMLIDAD